MDWLDRGILRTVATLLTPRRPRPPNPSAASSAESRNCSARDTAPVSRSRSDGTTSISDGRVTFAATIVRMSGEGIRRQDQPKSEACRRRLALPAFLLDALTARRVGAYSEWVFPAAVGTLRWPENVRQQWAKALDGSGVEWITPRDCRKAVATVPGVEAAQHQLGHADTAVTSKHYVEKPLERPDVAAMLDVFAAQNSE